jgi:hypothetical protein
MKKMCIIVSSEKTSEFNDREDIGNDNNCNEEHNKCNEKPVLSVSGDKSAHDG